MKIFAILTIVISLLFGVLYAKKNAAALAGEVVIIDDGYKKTGDASNEIVINDLSSGSENGYAPAASRQEQTKINADNSKTTVMFDGYGNKTETRYFDNNPLLLSITVKTAASGEKQVSVYAQNGTVGHLPENMLDVGLTAPANELAAAAGITEGRREPVAPTIVQSSQPLQPMPSYKFPVQTPALQPMPTEAVEAVQPEPEETTKPPVEVTVPPTAKTEKPASKIPSDDLD